MNLRGRFLKRLPIGVSGTGGISAALNAVNRLIIQPAWDQLALLSPGQFDGTEEVWVLKGSTYYRVSIAEYATLSIGTQSLWIPAGAMTPFITSGAGVGLIEMATNKNIVRTLDFDATTAESAAFEIAMPKSWDEGTLSFIPIWSHPATATNFGVVWSLSAVARGNDDALDAAFGTAVTSADTGGTANDLYRGPESAAMTVGGTPAENDVIDFRIQRTPADASDTLAVDARLHGIVLKYTTNAGSDG